MKYRDKLGGSNGGPQPTSVGASEPEDYKGRRELKSCLIGVSSHPLVWPLQKGEALFDASPFSIKHYSLVVEFTFLHPSACGN
ncbi:MAG: hypothetical protein K2M19_06785 [Muribaculaceae bacterium]|nr:hypothetical protein [Muribaculaceae bacterium]